MTVKPESQVLASRCTLPVRSLTFDRALQCRVEMDDAIVDEYATAMAEGAVFPAIDVVDVNGTMFVVDGWHRAYATKKAKLKTIEAIVYAGTRRDAILRAVHANGDHGVRRSHDDKRRAVRTLLMDPDWAKMSNRDLAGLGRVSHAFVGIVRNHYQLGRGELLTEERIDEIDGEPSSEWLALCEGVENWDRAKILALRTCFTLTALEEAVPYNAHEKHHRKALELQLSRIAGRAGDPWPWGKDKTEQERENRVRGIVDPLDITAALQSPECPLRFELFMVMIKIKKLDDAHPMDIERWMETFKIWRAFVRLAKLRIQQHKVEQANKPPSGWQIANSIETEIDAVNCSKAILAAPADALARVNAYRVPRESQSVLRAALDQAENADCANPTCDGWMRKNLWREEECAVCQHTSERTLEFHERAVAYVVACLDSGRSIEVGGRALSVETLPRLPVAPKADDDAVSVG